MSSGRAMVDGDREEAEGPGPEVRRAGRARPGLLFPLYICCVSLRLPFSFFFLLFGGMGVGNRVAPVWPGVVRDKVRSCRV